VFTAGSEKLGDVRIELEPAVPNDARDVTGVKVSAGVRSYLGPDDTGALRGLESDSETASKLMEAGVLHLEIENTMQALKARGFQVT
jgi:hypothetical protein